MLCTNCYAWSLPRVLTVFSEEIRLLLFVRKYRKTKSARDQILTSFTVSECHWVTMTHRNNVSNISVKHKCQTQTLPVWFIARIPNIFHTVFHSSLCSLWCISIGLLYCDQGVALKGEWCLHFITDCLRTIKLNSTYFAGENAFCSSPPAATVTHKVEYGHRGINTKIHVQCNQVRISLLHILNTVTSHVINAPCWSF